MFATSPAPEDLSGLSEEQLEEELAAQAAHVDAGLCRLVELAAECERRLPVAGDGVTFAGWLAWRCSLSSRQAKEDERIGARLRELPRIREAFARGQSPTPRSVCSPGSPSPRANSGSSSSLRR